MDVKKDSISGVIWTLTEKFGSRVLTLLIFLILARLLEPDDFGVVAIVSSIMALVQILSEQGFAAAIVQKPTLEKEDLDTSFWGSFGMNVILMGILIGSSGFVAEYFERPELEMLITVMSFNLVLHTFNIVQRSIFQRELKFKAIAIAQVIGIFVGGTVGVIAAFMDMGAWSLIYYLLTVGVIVNIVFWIQSDYRIGFYFSWQRYKKLFAFGVNVMGSKLLFYGNAEFVNLLIGALISVEAAGLFTIASKVYSTFKDLLVNSLGRVALPIFSKLQNDVPQLRSVLISYSGKVNLLIFPICFSIAIMAKDVVLIGFGEKYLGSAVSMSWLMASAGFLVLASYINDVLLAIDKSGTSFRANLVSTVLNFMMFGIFYTFGLDYVALGIFLRNALMALIAPFFLPTELGQAKWTIFKDLGKAILAGTAVALPLYFWPEVPFGDIYYYVHLGGKVIVTIALYSVFIQLFDPSIIRLFASMLKGPLKMVFNK
ncbi:MAG: lipopolysaccharide biosynthesis protein [Bacteroidia bacterium]